MITPPAVIASPTSPSGDTPHVEDEEELYENQEFQQTHYEPQPSADKGQCAKALYDYQAGE